MKGLCWSACTIHLLMSASTQALHERAGSADYSACSPVTGPFFCHCPCNTSPVFFWERKMAWLVMGAQTLLPVAAANRLQKRRFFSHIVTEHVLCGARSHQKNAVAAHHKLHMPSAVQQDRWSFLFLSSFSDALTAVSRCQYHDNGSFRKRCNSSPRAIWQSS